MGSVIYIKDLVVEGKHGVHPREKAKAQRFNVNVELIVDTAKAARSDNLADTLNYSTVRTIIVDTIQNNSFNLLEKLADQLAGQILADHRIQKMVLSIDKPDAFKSGVPGIRLEVKQPAGG